MSGSMTPTGMPPGAGGMPAPPPGGAPPVPGLPPGMAPPRPNIPATQPQANSGNIGAAMLNVRNALEFLQRAMPNIPMGAPIWKDVYDCVGKLSKHAGQQMPMGPMNQAALGLVRERSQNPLGPQMASMMGGPPNAGPALPKPSEG